ncbi:transcriptional regulator, TetR family [Singulisphaera sp. GP187]|uniref:TetR/AcrR family transcriptional regulator n=1 Tax=Singulisphaera sp. GP187 TaxID=1882752 RepID=UPI00092B7767|nr:TetR/AcrR family transcriptional regulator [Singulisphaera sp. GP187]SIO14499.1 transcriptional regulator, TetR family [Singulisphaera sp. GP187]
MTKNEPSEAMADDGDSRVQRSRKTVLAATLQLLAEAGFSGVSVDEVSRRSGVAKTTIYRHWPSRAALLLEACSNLGAKSQVPDTGTLKGDLTAVVTQFAGRLRSDRWATILPSVIDAAERDPELAEVHTRLHAGFMAPLYTIIARAQERGELSGDCDPSTLVASVVGPLYYRRWFDRQPLDETFVKSIVDNVLDRPTRPGQS